MFKIIDKRKFSHTVKNLYDKRPHRFPQLTESYYHNAGENNITLSSWTGNDLICSHAENTDIALHFQNENNLKLTWKELYQKSTQLADSLQHLGLQKNQPLAVWSPNIHEWVIGQFAAARLGLPYVTLNPLYKGVELEELLRDINCSSIIYPIHVKNTAMNFDQMISEMKHPPTHQIFIDNDSIVDKNSEQYANFSPMGKINFQDLLQSGSVQADLEKNRPNMDTLNMIQFTSGTTGKPKPAALTNHNVINNSKMIASRIGATRETRLCLPVPLFHCFGNVNGTLVAAHSGAMLSLPYPTWSAEKTITAIRDQKCNMTYGVPTMFIDLFSQIDQNPALKSALDSLKQGVGAGSLLPPELIKKADKDFGIKTQVVYGTTENSPVATWPLFDTVFSKRCIS